MKHNVEMIKYDLKINLIESLCISEKSKLKELMLINIIIRIKNEFAPKLGEESKLKLKTLHSYSKELPEINSEIFEDKIIFDIVDLETNKVLKEIIIEKT